jgi:xanthine dehydrogenase accessory factor
MKPVFTDLVHLLEGGEDAVLAVIYARSGSAPRTAGARMLVRPDGSIAGTIGGGLLEARVQQIAQRVYETRRTAVEEFELTGADASQMEMICGGEVAVLIEFIDARETGVLEFYRAAAASAGDHRRSWLLTAIPTAEAVPGQGPAARALLSQASDQHLQVMAGSLANIQVDLDSIASFTQQPEVTSSRYPVLYRQDRQSLLVEPLGAGGTLFLFGGGHVSQKLAPLADTLGFRIVVVDDRPEFANRQCFPHGQDFIIPASFEQAVEQCDVDADSYLVIVTRGHLHDKTVLAQALRTPAAYIGMIGSIRKRNAIYDELRREGFSDMDFSRVYSPIGLKIGAESPEEIAVSIAAELIQVRSGLG